MRIINVDLKIEMYINIKGLCVVKFILSGSMICYISMVFFVGVRM